MINKFIKKLNVISSVISVIILATIIFCEIDLFSLRCLVATYALMLISSNIFINKMIKND